MNIRRPFRLATLISLVLFVPLVTWANNTGTSQGAGNTGASAIGIFANLSFASMRAQNSPSKGWRILAFIFGFPRTLVSLLIVDEGSERAYGIEMPRRSQ